MALSLVALAALATAAWLPTADAALRGQHALLHNDIVLSDFGQALEENGTTAELEMRVNNMAEALRPTFLALPRSPEGHLDASAVRYLLHRYYIDRDGWVVQGFDASGEVANDSLSEVVLHGGALAETLSQRLAARGLSLREVAVMATALEVLVTSETARRLQRAYQILGLAHRMENATERELGLIFNVYLLMYSLGMDYESMTWKLVNEQRQSIRAVYPMWDQLTRWAHAVRKTVLASIPEQKHSFTGLLRVLVELEHLYGRWQNGQCSSVKKALQELETPGTGRIPLHAFYSAALPGGWQPLESKEYLSHIGALDETDSSNPSVVIPNYFDTPTNCAMTSKFYSVCCISECEALVGHLERNLGSPDALPQQILDIVERLPSNTVKVPRTLPVQLTKRLASIAELHGGHAPLHGRLFRQWMHHAFPNECSFPALATTQKLMMPAEFTLQTGHKAIVDPADLQRPMQTTPRQAVGAVPVLSTSRVALLGELPWSDDEQIFITSPSQRPEVTPSDVPTKRTSQAGIFAVLAVPIVIVLACTRRSPKDSILPP